MKKRRILTTLIALSVILTVIGGTIPAAGQEDAPEHASPLLDMLALVPDDPMVHDSGGWASSWRRVPKGRPARRSRS